LGIEGKIISRYGSFFISNAPKIAKFWLRRTKMGISKVFGN
jgi:hypothetical protein